MKNRVKQILKDQKVIKRVLDAHLSDETAKKLEAEKAPRRQEGNSMLTLHQQATRFAPPAVGAWVATHKLGPGRGFLDEDRALREVSERLCELSALTQREPTFTTKRHASGAITVRCDPLGVVYQIRGA
jgi:hypothetical protein